MKDDLDNLFEEFKEVNNLKEEELSRVWEIVNLDGFTFVIITAWRGDEDENTNQRNQAQLKSEIRKKGWGFREMEGAWHEEREDANGETVFVPVSEPSLLVVPPRVEPSDNPIEEVSEFTKEMTNRFNQDGAFYRDIPMGATEDDVNLFYYDRRSDSSDKVTDPFVPQKKGKDGFSILRNGRKFTFASEFIDSVDYESSLKEVVHYGKKRMVCELTLEEANLALDNIKKKRCSSFGAVCGRGILTNSLKNHINYIRRS